MSGETDTRTRYMTQTETLVMNDPLTFRPFYQVGLFTFVSCKCTELVRTLYIRVCTMVYKVSEAAVPPFPSNTDPVSIPGDRRTASSTSSDDDDAAPYSHAACLSLRIVTVLCLVPGSINQSIIRSNLSHYRMRRSAIATRKQLGPTESVVGPKTAQ